MGTRNLLFIESAAGFGGSVVLLARIIKRFEPREYRAFAVVAAECQAEYLKENCPIAEVLIERPRVLTREAGVGKVVCSTLGRAGASGRRLAAAITFGINWIGPIRHAADRVYRHFQNVRFDAVWLNNGISHDRGLGARLAKRWRVPLVCKVNGFEYVSPLNRALARQIDLFLPCSRCVCEPLFAMGMPADRIIPIHSTVDPGEFDPRQYTASDEFRRQPAQLTFGIIGTLLKWKGHEVFLDAARLVMDEFPEAVAVIAGDAPDGSADRRQELQHRAKSLGIADRVLFTGHRRDVPQVLAGLDIAVHASVEPEPFGMVIVEARAMRRPVVATRAGGPMEIVHPDETGFLVEPGSAADMAAAIARLLRDAELRRSMGEKARRRVVEEFGIETHTRATEAALRSIFQRSTRSRTESTADDVSKTFADTDREGSERSQHVGDGSGVAEFTV